MAKKEVYGNAEYVRRRDKLIPLAEEICDKALGVKNKRGERDLSWTRLFMRTMDRLWKLEYLKEKQQRMVEELSRINSRLEAESEWSAEAA